MRKMCVLIMVVLLLSGCSPTEHEVSDGAIRSSISSGSQTEIKATEDEGNTTAESTAIPDRDDNTTHISEASQTWDEEHKKETTAKKTLSSQPLDSDNSVVNKDLTVPNGSQSAIILQ